MNYSTFFSKQARKPSGIFGRFYMSRVFDKGNTELNALVFETLSVEENDHVLEIGSGTGMLIKFIADNISKVLVEGVDFSKPMVKMATRNNKKYINEGRVKIHLGDFDEVALDSNNFDKIFTVNTVYFWKNPDATIARICRILKPGGRLVVGFHDKSEMEKMPLNRDVFKYYSTHDLRGLLSNHDVLKNIDLVSRSGEHKVSYCAVCTKSKA